MRASGVLLLTLGVLVVLAGLGMDTTRTTTTCYEADYSWNTADARGCVETTYSDPAPKVVAVAIGVGLVLGGAVLARRGGDATPPPRGRVGGPQRDDSGELPPEDSVGGSRTDTFADTLRDYRDDE